VYSGVCVVGVNWMRVTKKSKTAPPPPSSLCLAASTPKLLSNHS